jgi:hypothetical protein
LTGFTNKWATGFIFFIARPFADQNKGTLRIPLAEDDVPAAFAQSALDAQEALGLDQVKFGHGLNVAGKNNRFGDLTH